MKAYIKGLLKSGFIRNSSSVLSGNLFGQFVLFLSSLVIAKFYSAEEFGIYSLFIAIVSFLILIPPLRLDQALLLEKNKSRLTILLKVIGINTIIFLVLLSPILIIVKYLGFFDILNRPHIIVFIHLSIITSVSIQVLLQFFNNIGLFRRIGLLKAAQGSSMGLGQIAFGLIDSLKYFGLIFGKIIADLIPTLQQLFFLKKTNYKLPKHQLTVKRYFAQLRKHKNFVLFNTPHALLTNLSSNIPYFILGYFFSSYVLGIFGWVSRSFYAPMTLIANSVGRTFNQRISENLHTTQPIKKLFFQVTSALLLLSIIPSFVMGFWGQDIYGFIFGEEWSEAGTYLAYLLPWYILSFTYSPIAFLPIALGAQKTMLFFEVCSVLMRTSFLIIGGYFQSIQIALAGYSISGALILCLMFIYILHLINTYEQSLTQSK